MFVAEIGRNNIKATLPPRVDFFITFINLINDIDNSATFYLQLIFMKLFDTNFTITILRYERTVIDKCRRKCGML
jgi:hypothetical protein